MPPNDMNPSDYIDANELVQVLLTGCRTSHPGISGACRRALIGMGEGAATVLQDQIAHERMPKARRAELMPFAQEMASVPKSKDCGSLIIGALLSCASERDTELADEARGILRRWPRGKVVDFLVAKAFAIHPDGRRCISLLRVAARYRPPGTASVPLLQMLNRSINLEVREAARQVMPELNGRSPGPAKAPSRPPGLEMLPRAATGAAWSSESQEITDEGDSQTTISQRALVRRLNLLLKQKWQRLKRCGPGDSEGEYFIEDILDKRVVEEWVDLAELGRKLGVLKPGDAVAYT